MRALILLLLLSGPLAAGPWPRGEGRSFVLQGQEGGVDGWSSLYAERGLGDLTFGLDAGGRLGGALDGTLDPMPEGRARAFLRVPLVPPERVQATWPRGLDPWLAAIELGIGAEYSTDGTTHATGSLGLTVGRPLEIRAWPGWTAADVRVTAGGADGPRWNAAAVLGARPTGRITVELGLFVEHGRGTYWTAAPTLQYEFGAAGAARLGFAVTDGGETVLRLGWARAF
jgi:hypothetical protein